MIKSFIKLNRELWDNRKIIITMGKTEFKNEYIGSALGIFWGIVKPFTMILVYTIVFQNKIQGLPYYIWIMPGLFLWMFLSDALVGGTSAIRSNSHLVQKVVFPVSVLPVANIFSKLINHLIYMVLALGIMYFTGVTFAFGTLQVFYYLAASVIFTVGLTRLLSAMAVMSSDVVHLITTLMQLLLWASPVLWSGTDLAGRESLRSVLPFLKLNPYFYLIEGYRNSFFAPSIRFYDDMNLMLWFWGITLVVYLFGSAYYARNRKNFADVL